MIQLLFGIHCHQPVGNFDRVIAREVERAYAPFLEVVEDFPDFHFSAHYSGWLLRWIADHRPEVVERLARLVARGQVELLTGGFYEPVLAAIPRPDRRAQIERHQAFLEERFGVRARGLWLTERVWEPELVSDLEACGIEYVTVDDYHFQSAGFDRRELSGCFLTEDAGSRVAVFPIDMVLRYLTPFHPPEEAVAYLLEAHERWGWEAATIADDGEKYGTWPGTHDLVYGERWLARFLELVCREPGIRAATFSEHRATHPPRGLCYLPNTSYFEMGEWSLPAEQAVRLHHLVAEQEAAGRLEAVKPLLAGGIWKGFFVKYPEANRMHKRAIALSRRIAALGEGAPAEAAEALYTAQANDAYWHGVFGGLYLPHLRHTVWRHLNRCEALLPPAPERELRDEDGDGREELHLRSDRLHCTVDAAAGGVVVELSDLESGVNFGATLARRFEHYHATAAKGAEMEGEGAETIHHTAGRSLARARSEIVYDLDPPAIGRLRHLAPGEPLAPRVVAGGHPPPRQRPAEARIDPEGRVALALPPRLEVEVEPRLAGGRLRLHYRVAAEGGLPAGRLGVEVCLALPGCDSPATHYRWPGEAEIAGGLG
ncbi:MAG: DUF1925 domain-containing protein, partial [Nitrospirae bacterium]